MARRRYISTSISIDLTVAKLGKEYGDFACLLYTWLIPHAEDDGSIHADIDKLLLLVLPAFRWKTAEDVKFALEGMDELGLVKWDRENNLITFPDSFFRYQSYITEARRKKVKRNTNHDKTPQSSGKNLSLTNNSANQREPAQNTANCRTIPQNSADQRKTPLCLGLSSGEDNSPTESAEAAPVNRPVELSEVPAIMRPVVKYLLHETGRENIEPSELPHVRELERLHVPARITQEIETALERFKRNARDPTTLTFEYLLNSLKHQKSRKSQKPRASPCAKNTTDDEVDYDAIEREYVMKRFGGD